MWVEAVLRETLRTDGGTLYHWGDFEAGAVDGCTLQTNAPVGIGGVGVGGEAGDGVEVDLVEELLGVFECVCECERSGAVDGIRKQSEKGVEDTYFVTGSSPVIGGALGR